MNDTREHILVEALKLFAQKGFKAVTMKDIVENTGLSKGAFYHYFKSKEEVFKEVTHYFYEDIFTQNFENFSQESLRAFYKDYLKNARKTFATLQKITNKNNSQAVLNPYLLLFDALTLIPSEVLYEENQNKELNYWREVIQKARDSGEINSHLTDKEIAEMFMFLSDGMGIHMILKNSEEYTLQIHHKVKKLWDNFYSLLKN